MKCDIIIPAYQAAAALPKTLAALAAQAVPPRWQVRLIVSDDGSTDSTVKIAQTFLLPAGWEKDVLKGPHAGPAAARNRGLKAADGDVVVFVGADIILQPGSLARHLEFHQDQPAAHAALGMVRWDPRLPPSPLMEWMAHGGQQNDFDSLLGQSQADPRTHWYGSHLSLKRTMAQTLLFPEGLAGYGWEDLSVGREAAQRGVKLFILHRAVGLHCHAYTPRAIGARQYAVGLNMLRFQSLHPREKIMPRRSLANHVRRAIFILCGGQTLLFWCIVISGKQFSLPRLFLVFTATQFWRGVWRSHGGFLAFLRKNR
jgi:glycosyltransferase involved in cell wall biosynthesis